MSRINFYLIILLILPNFLTAQISDLARLDYTGLPDQDGTSYSRIRAQLNVPISLKKEGAYFFVGAAYGKFNLSLKPQSNFNRNEVDEFHKVKLNVAYTIQLKNDWRFGIQISPEISTNEKFNELNTRELVYDGLLMFYKDNTKNSTIKKPYKLALGISYASNSSVSFPLPLISYYRKFHPKWSYSVGVPKSNVQYHFSANDRLKLFTQLDGFGATLSEEVPVVNSPNANRISMTLILSGLQYEHYFTKRLQAYARLGYIWSQSIKLRRGKDKILRLDGQNTIYLRTGIRLKI